MLWALILMPLLAAAAAFFLRSDRLRRALLVTTAAAHAALVAAAWRSEPAPILDGWLAVGPLERLFLAITSTLFLAASVYAVGYLRREARGARKDLEEAFLFSNAPEATFTACLLAFLGTMTLVIVSQHFGILWVAIEATTLASAPLIFFHRHHRSLEATWKYLLICSVGIALALLGNFFLAAALPAGTDGHAAMTVASLVQQGGTLNATWLRAAMILMLVGYGTKMGLAPLHTWLPDAHSEAPSVVSALLSGALLNCAFLGILRIHAVCVAAGQAEFSQDLLVLMGLASMAMAAVFILRQADYKRMLAYSSVEHMGILALGVGLGGAAGFGALLHAVNHSLTKAMLFLVAGNILAVYRTKQAAHVRGVLSVLPASGMLWLAGFFAIVGSPPFGLFLSELKVLQGAVAAERWALAALYLGLLVTIFIGMAAIVLRMAHGRPEQTATAPALAVPRRESLSAVLPPMVLGAMVLVLGLYVPPQLTETIEAALRALGVN